LEEHYLNGRLKTVTAYMGADYSDLINTAAAAGADYSDLINTTAAAVHEDQPHAVSTGNVSGDEA
jgi:electron transfer flavoprotein alpha/beta subunit